MKIPGSDISQWNISRGELGYDRLFDMIERLISIGAQVRIGKRRVHVISRDGGGMCKVMFERPAWDAYTTTGRKMPGRGSMRDGL